MSELDVDVLVIGWGKGGKTLAGTIARAGRRVALVERSQAVESALTDAEPGARLEALAAAYVAYSFEHRALTSVAEAEIVGLPAELQRPLIAAQRRHIGI